MLALALVVALAAVAYLRPKPDAEDHALSALAPADVKTIRVEPQSAPPIVLERAGKAWRMSAPVRARADADRVESLLALLTAKSKHKFAADDLARFDLDKPGARVTFNEQTMNFGTVNPLSGEQYVATVGSVFLVAHRLAAAVPRRVQDVIAKRLFADEEQPAAFELKQFGVVRRDGKWLTERAAAAPSQDDYNRWTTDWRLATALRVEPFAGKATADTIEIGMDDGRRVKLTVLAREPELQLLRSDEGLRYDFAAAAAKQMLAPPAARDAR